MVNKIRREVSPTTLNIIEKFHGTPIEPNCIFNRSANLWNSMQNQLVNAETVKAFKASLDCWMISKQANQL